MNPHIDLIQHQERRSAGLISPLFVVRLIAGLAMTVLLFWLVLAYLDSRQLQNALGSAETQWQALAPRHESAQDLRRDLVRIREIESEIQAWGNARLAWTPVLKVIRELVLPTIQFTQLQSEESLQLEGGGAPVRIVTLKIWGRARGESPDSDVQTLRGNILSHPDLQDSIAQVVIPPGTFGVDPSPEADRAHRVFQLHIRLVRRRFE